MLLQIWDFIVCFDIKFPVYYMKGKLPVHNVEKNKFTIGTHKHWDLKTQGKN